MNRLLPLLLVVLVTGQSRAAVVKPPLGEAWRLCSPLTTSENLNAVASNGVNRVAVGNRGTMVATGSGSWTLGASGVVADLNDITWSADQGQFIAVGSEGSILLSTEGTAWVNHSGLPTDRFNAVVTMSATEAVIVGSTITGAGLVLTTSDKGATWVRHLVPGATGLVDVTWTGSKLLAVAANKVFTSSDKGRTWTSVALAATTPSSIKYVAGAATAVITGTKSWRSVNGGPWTAMTAPSPALRLNVAGNELLGVNRQGEVWSSTDAGAAWQRLLTAQNIPFNDVVKAGAEYTVVGDGGVIESSPNGTNWGPSAAQVRSVAVHYDLFGGNDPLYVAVGDGVSWAGVMSAAVDGDIIWTPHSLPSFAANQVMWSGSQFVAVGTAIWTSSDGIAWTRKAVIPGSASMAHAVTALGTRLYVFAYDPLSKASLIAYSTDKGDTWSPFTEPSGNVAAVGQQVPMYSAAKAAGDYFIAVGQAGRYMVAVGQSADSWFEGKLALPYAGEDFTSVLWGEKGGRFVMGTNHGGFWTYDGQRYLKARVWRRDALGLWQKTHDGQGTKAVRRIVWAGDEFIAVGDGGTLWKSFNGYDWREYGPYETGGSGTPSNLMDVLYVYGSSSSLIVAAGGIGTFVSSDGADTPVPPTITFTPNQSTVRENGGIATVTVEISERLFPGALTVPVVISPASKKMKASVSSLTFAEGEFSKAFTVAGVDSAALEQDLILSIGTSSDVAGDLRQMSDYYDASNANTIRRGWIRLVDKLPLNSVSFVGTGVHLTEGWVPTAKIEVRLERPVVDADVIVPLVFGGNTPLTSYVRPTGNVVVIPKGELSASFFISVKNDLLASDQRSIQITLGQPPQRACLPLDPSTMTFGVMISDDDTLPSIVTQPKDQLAAVGDNVTLTAQIGAGIVNSVPNAYTVQWLKNGAAIPGHPATSYTGNSTALLNLTAVSLSTAGEYSLEVSSIQGNAKSTAAKLAVVDSTPKVLTAKMGAPLLLSAPAAGLGLRYQWLQNGSPISGQIYSSLFVSNVGASLYQFSCEVSQGSATITSSAIAVYGVDGVPIIANPVFGPAAVAADFLFTPVASKVVDEWTITGLPLGLSFNRTTGAITGRPSKAGTYAIIISAVNAVGKSPAVKGTLVVAALTSGLTGNFHANVESDTSGISYLGAHISIAVSNTGGFTGSYLTESGSSSFIGNLGGSPGSVRTATIDVAGQTIAFQLDGDLGTIAGDVSSSYRLHGWRQTAATSARTGSYTWSIADTDPNAGFGFGLFTVSATGAVTGKITMANFASHTFASVVGPDGHIPVYGPLQTSDSTGSALGDLLVTSQSPPLYTANTITGTITRYAQNGPVRSFITDGGHYFVPTASQVVMNLPTPVVANNLTVTFTGADLGSGPGLPNGKFTAKPVALVVPPSSNPASTSLVFTAATGEFFGQFVDLFGTDQTRVAFFRGVLYRPAGSPNMMGRGSFIVPDATGTLTGSVMLDRGP